MTVAHLQVYGIRHIHVQVVRPFDYSSFAGEILSHCERFESLPMRNIGIAFIFEHYTSLRRDGCRLRTIS
jgi:hypothetical protein